MDRFVLFVDAAYLLAAGGELCHGTNRRSDLQIKFEKAVADLREICRKDSGLSPLRVYWYDAAKDAHPNWEQQQIASLDGVQLRLGRLTRRGQKGVDSRIVRDMIVLAHNRACTDAYLVSGDDDLREGVSEAQEAGVSVKLIGVEPLTGFQNQAPTLIRAADGLLSLSKSQILPFLQRRAKIVPVPVGPTSSAPPDSAALASGTGAIPTPEEARKVGEEFAQTWMASATKEQKEQVLTMHPNIPPDLDHQLLVFCKTRIGYIERGSGLRVALRTGFRVVIKPSS